LKRRGKLPLLVLGFLSALDPGKQGLKPGGADEDGYAAGFQRLIQENKD